MSEEGITYTKLKTFDNFLCVYRNSDKTGQRLTAKLFEIKFDIKSNLLHYFGFSYISSSYRFNNNTVYEYNPITNELTELYNLYDTYTCSPLLGMTNDRYDFFKSHSSIYAVKKSYSGTEHVSSIRYDNKLFTVARNTDTDPYDIKKDKKYLSQTGYITGQLPCIDDTIFVSPTKDGINVPAGYTNGGLINFLSYNIVDHSCVYSKIDTYTYSTTVNSKIGNYVYAIVLSTDVTDISDTEKWEQIYSNNINTNLLLSVYVCQAEEDGEIKITVDSSSNNKIYISLFTFSATQNEDPIITRIENIETATEEVQLTDLKRGDFVICASSSATWSIDNTTPTKNIKYTDDISGCLASFYICEESASTKLKLNSSSRNIVLVLRPEFQAMVFDENIKPENIKKGVTILGVEGTLESNNTLE